MRSILFDTNVILDVLLDRQPHSFASGAAWAFVENGKAEGMLAAHAITTLHYLVRKELGNPKAKRVISEILKVFEVAAVNRSVLDEALESSLSDFEDAVTAAAAHAAGCDCIVTRDPKGFRGSRVRCMTPEAALPLLRKNP
jgi:predicted nucleic acid-binding protein